MKKLLLTLVLVMFSTVLFSQSGNIQIYNKFYMSQMDKSLDAQNFLLSITLDRTGKTCSAGAYFDNGTKMYVFGLTPTWAEVKSTDTFSVTIHIHMGLAEYAGGMAYAGFINPIFSGKFFTAKCSAQTLSGISQGIPMIKATLK